jgi:hypothetical protein
MAQFAIQEANIATDAVNKILDQIEPIADKFGVVLAKYQDILNDLFHKYTIGQNISALTDSAQKRILDKARDEIAQAQDEDKVKEIILRAKKSLEATNYHSQSGGKKILSRTNKSISEFLNSKVTFQSILKRMTSKYKKGKHGFTRRIKRRLYKR